MKKILLTLALAFCCAAGQGQTTAKPADVNIQELNTKWAKFTQYAEQKQINKAVEEGIRISTLFTQNRQYKEAFATCRQMDALIYYNEQEKKSPEYKLRFMVGKERLRYVYESKKYRTMQDTIETTSFLYRPIKIRLFTRRASNDGSQLLSNFRYDRQKLGMLQHLIPKALCR